MASGYGARPVCRWRSTPQQPTRQQPTSEQPFRKQLSGRQQTGRQTDMADSPTTNERRLADLLLKEEITEFLYHEADLLDERRYDEWLELLDDEVEYAMPMRLNIKHDQVKPDPAKPETDRSVTKPGEEVCWFDEGKDTLAKRVEQIQTGEHWAEEPFSRISHLVSNIRLLSVQPNPFEPIEVEVGCRFLVYRNRVAAETDLWVGRRTDTLLATPDGWRLRRRYLLLDQNVLLAKNLTVLF